MATKTAVSSRYGSTLASERRHQVQVDHHLSRVRAGHQFQSESCKGLVGGQHREDCVSREPEQRGKGETGFFH